MDVGGWVCVRVCVCGWVGVCAWVDVWMGVCVCVNRVNFSIPHFT